MEKRVVVTGMGCITPLGNEIESTWENILKGVSGVGYITQFDADGFKTKISAEVKGFNAEELFGKKESRKIDRFAQFAMASALQAIADADIEITEEKLHNYYHENENIMKEPDLFSFYEILVNSSENVSLVVDILTFNKDVSHIRSKIESSGMMFNNYADVPAFKIPKEILNVLIDLKESKIGTMVVGDNELMIYKLIKRIIGKKLKFKDIKENLAKSLIENGKKEIYLRVVNEELNKANVEYINISCIDKK